MSERYKTRRITFYQVIDTQVPDGEEPSVHYEGKDQEFAEQLAADFNENHQNRLAAEERNAQEGREEAARRAIHIAEEGRGEERVG